MNGPSPNDVPRESWRGIWIPAVVVLLWCALQVLRDPGFFWHDDFQAYYSPVFEEIVRSWRGGEWPLLNPHSWCAHNMAGEFQNGTFSPPFNLLLVAIWSLPLALPLQAGLLATVHLMWLAMGVFLLGRQRGLTIAHATTAALATTLSGWIIGWAASNWITFLTGFCWIPWVWWALQTAIESNSTWKRWLRPGLMAALLITEGNAFAAVEVAIIAIWLAAHAVIREKNWRALGPLGVAGLLATGLSAPAWWLLIDMLHSSARGEWGRMLHAAWSVPGTAWPGLILPSYVTEWRQFGETLQPQACLELACGVVPIAVLAAAFVSSPLATFRKLRWEAILLVLCILLVTLPSIGQFRWSFRWLPMFHLVMALAAMRAWHEGLGRRAPEWATGLTLVVWLAAALTGQRLDPVLPISILVLGVAWWLANRATRESIRNWAPAAMVAVSLGLSFALLPPNPAQPIYTFDETIRQPAPLDPARHYLSLYSSREITEARTRPRGSGTLLRPANAMLYANLRFLNGYSAFAGHEVKALFGTHGSVDAAKAQSLTSPDGERLLLFLGVDGIVVSPEYLPFAAQLGPEWQKVAETSEGTVFHRQPARYAPVKVLNFVFDRPGITLATPHLQILDERRNRISLRVTPDLTTATAAEKTETACGIAAIAFTRPFLAGYRAYFNGQPVPIREYRKILPLVELPGAASGVLELRYRPLGLTAGAFLSGLTASVVLLVALASGRRRQPSTHQASAKKTPRLSKAQFAALYVLFLALGATLMASAAEVILRLTGYAPWQNNTHSIAVEPGGQFYAPHPALGYSHLPGTFHLRLESGYTFTTTHRPDTLRITRPLESPSPSPTQGGLWIFGCSFTHGWSLDDEQTYPWMLQEKFPAYDVRNFGVGGYGTLQSLLQFREALKTAKPKVVVLAYADFHDTRNTFPRARRKEVVPWNKLGPMSQPYARLDGAGALQYFTGAAEYSPIPLTRDSALINLLDDSLNRADSSRVPSRRVTELLIAEMAALAREHQVKFVLANISGGPAMLEFARQQGIPQVDISVDLAQPWNTNLPHDGHPSAVANRQYAEKLDAYLRPILSSDE